MSHVDVFLMQGNSDTVDFGFTDIGFTDVSPLAAVQACDRSAPLVICSTDLRLYRRFAFTDVSALTTIKSAPNWQFFVFNDDFHHYFRHYKQREEANKGHALVNQLHSYIEEIRMRQMTHQHS